MNTWLILLKREFWEHKGSSLYLPLILIAVFLFVFAMALSNSVNFIDNVGIQIKLDFDDEHEKMLDAQTLDPHLGSDIIINKNNEPSEKNWDFHQQWHDSVPANSPLKESLPDSPEPELAPDANHNNGSESIKHDFGSEKGNKVLNTIYGIFYLFWLFSVFMYLLDTLYQERKDRSIIFWQSMPISESKTVISKLLYGGYAMAAIYWLASIVIQLLMAVGLNSDKVTNVVGEVHIDVASLALQQLTCFLLTPIIAMPLLAWLLTVSVSANRAPLLIAITVPAIIIGLEYWVFSSDMVIRSITFLNPLEFMQATATGEQGVFYRYLQSATFWIGLCLGLAALFATTKLRTIRAN